MQFNIEFKMRENSSKKERFPFYDFRINAIMKLYKSRFDI